jgi:hypothetical protein
VIQFIGGSRLAETNRTAARNYVTALLEGGRSANTIRKCKAVLGALFAMAIVDGYLDVNPFRESPQAPAEQCVQGVRDRADLQRHPAV